MAFSMRAICMVHCKRTHASMLSSRLAVFTACARPYSLSDSSLHDRPHLCMVQTSGKHSRLYSDHRMTDPSSPVRPGRQKGRYVSHLVPRVGNLSQVSSSCFSSPGTRSAFSDHGSVLLGIVTHTESCTRSHFVQRRFSSTAAAASSSSVPSAVDKTSLLQMQPDLDLETRLSSQNLDDLRRNLSARGLDFNLDQLLADYECWKELNERKTRLEMERLDIAKTMGSLVKGKTSQDREKEKEGLTARGRAIKEQMKDLMPSWWSADQKVMTQALRLPTALHPLTPELEDQIVEVFKGTMEDAGSTSHIQIGERLGLLKFSSVGGSAVYMLDQAAWLEQSLLHSAASRLVVRGHSPIAAPDIFRSLVLEGCGLEPEDSLSLQAKDEGREINAYYLKGNSLLSYAAFLTRMQVRREQLPVRMYSIGRHYRPQEGDLPGLYGCVQSNRVTMFGASGAGEAETLDLHDDMVGASWDMVSSLGLPARKTLVCARKLAPSESLRTEVHVWASSVQQYVPMAYVSVHNDYVSRRLTTKTSNGDWLHMVSGVAMDTAVVVASMLEHSCAQGELLLKESTVSSPD